MQFRSRKDKIILQQKLDENTDDDEDSHTPVSFDYENCISPSVNQGAPYVASQSVNVYRVAQEVTTLCLIAHVLSGDAMHKRGL